MTNVTIISGFLGAGKTTLIKKLLKEAFAGQKCVLLENEYGEVGIDGSFMKDSGIEITELNSGCICCTLAGDFTKAINEIVDRFHPDRLIIEPSGVGKLSDIRRAVEDIAKTGLVTLGGSVTVVDAAKCKMYLKNLSFGEFYIDQVKCAETVIFSRSQLVSEEKLTAAFDMIRALNAEARIITTNWDEISGEIIMDAVEHPTQLIDVDSLFPRHEHHHDDDEEEEEEHEHHHHHHGEDDDDGDEHEHHHHDHDGDEDDDDEEEHEHHHHGHPHDDDDDEDGHEHHHHHHHHHHHADGEHDADEVFDDMGIETAAKLDMEVLKTALKAIEDQEKYGMVLRMKGIMPTTDGKWVEFDYTPGESEIREGRPDYTGRLCVIGVGLKRKAIRELLNI